MSFDPLFYSYGVGLCAVGWAIGLAVNLVFKMLARIGYM